jgi:hypothetical protein
MIDFFITKFQQKLNQINRFVANDSFVNVIKRDEIRRKLMKKRYDNNSVDLQLLEELKDNTPYLYRYHFTLVSAEVVIFRKKITIKYNSI